MALADTATYTKGAADGTHLVTLYNGRRYEGVPGRGDFRVIEFREHGIPIVTPDDAVARHPGSGHQTDARTLGFERAIGYRAAAIQGIEPIMALVLTLIAVPLSRLRPRQGRYARVGFAIVVYFVYSNLLSAAKVWVEKGDLPPGDRRLVGAHRALGARPVPGVSARREPHEHSRPLPVPDRDRLHPDGDGRAVDPGRPVRVHQPAEATSASAITATGDAFLYTLLNLPQQAFDLLPIGAMIGALMGLGNLAAGSELVVTRASGVSVWRIAWPVGLAGLTLALVMYGIGEYVAPPLAQFAKREKTTSKLADVSFAGTSSAWVKDGNLILRVQTGEVDQAFGGVSLFELDGANRLRSIQRAERISVADPGAVAPAQCRDDALRRRITSTAKWSTRSRCARRSIRSSWGWRPPTRIC